MSQIMRGYLHEAVYIKKNLWILEQSKTQSMRFWQMQKNRALLYLIDEIFSV